MARLSHAIELSMIQGRVAGLAALDSLALDPRMAASHRFAAARARLHESAGDLDIASRFYGNAAESDDEHAGAELPAAEGRSDARRPRCREIVIGSDVSAC
jgi:predicted RNA polymerase sigma factor